MMRRASFLLALALLAGCNQQVEVGTRIEYDGKYLCSAPGAAGTPCAYTDEETSPQSGCCGGPLWSETCGTAGTTCHRPKADGVGICVTPAEAAMIDSVCIWPLREL